MNGYFIFLGALVAVAVIAVCGERKRQSDPHLLDDREYFE